MWWFRMLSHCLEGEGIRLKRDVNDVVRIFFSSAWQLKSSTWYLSGGKEIRRGVQGGGGAVSWSRFVDFAEQLSFCHTHGPIPLPSPVEAIAFSSGNDLLCFRLMTLMLIRMCLLHRLLVSVSQKSFEGFLSTEPFVVCVFSSLFPSSDCFYACGILPTCPIVSPNAVWWKQNSGFPTSKNKRSILAPRDLPNYLFLLIVIIILCHFLVVHHPQVLYVPAASTATLLGNTKKVFKFGH